MSKVSLFEDDALVVAATNVNQGTDSAFRYSGRLGATVLFVDNLSTTNISWIAITTRDHDVDVILTYAAPAVNFTVTAGNPLLVSNEGGGVGFVGVSITNANTNKPADVEIHIYEGDAPFSPPDPAFLILNAGTGIGEDGVYPGSVETWTDTRPTTLAPLDFRFSGTGATAPLLIESDSDFGGQPSVDFSGEQVGSSAYTYSASASTIFNFMRDTAFTVAAILKIPDGPYSDTGVTVGEYGQGIWNNDSFTSTKNGYRAFLEGGNRMQVHSTINSTPVEDDIATEEITNKSMVVIWKCDGTNMQVYYQGRWHTSFAVSQDTANDTTPFAVGNALVGSTGQSFKGKIADIRVYDFEWSTDESDSYIATAVSNYGVDDTQGVVMPFVSSCNGMWRASRGINLSVLPPLEGLVDFWNDTRREAISGGNQYVSLGLNPSITVADDKLNDEHAVTFSGSSQLLANVYSGTTGNFLSGDSPGFTMCFVYYENGILDKDRALFAMADYDVGSLDGVNIFYQGGAGDTNSLTYEVDNGAGADVVLTEGRAGADVTAHELANTPRAVIFRVDGTSWWVDEKNLSTGVVTSSNGAMSATPSAVTTAVAYLFSFPTKGRMVGGLGEFVSDNSKKTNDEVADYFAYATSRYGS